MSGSRNVGKPNRSFAQKIPRHYVHKNDITRHYPMNSNHFEAPYRQDSGIEPDKGFSSPTLNRIAQDVQNNQAIREFEKELNRKAIDEHFARERYEIRMKRQDEAIRRSIANAKVDDHDPILDYLMRGNHIEKTLDSHHRAKEQFSQNDDVPSQERRVVPQMVEEKVPEPIEPDHFKVDYDVDSPDDEVPEDETSSNDEEEDIDDDFDDMPEEEQWAATIDIPHLRKLLRKAQEREGNREPAYAMSLHQVKEHFATFEAENDKDATLLNKAKLLQELVIDHYRERHEQKKKKYEQWVKEQFDEPEGQPAYAA